MIFEFWKHKIVTGGQVWEKTEDVKDSDLWLQKLGHEVCLVSRCIIMQESEGLKLCFQAVGLVVLLQLF